MSLSNDAPPRLAPGSRAAQHESGEASQAQLEEDANEQTFSLRSIVAGGIVGSLICFASVYYGLQSGNTNSMPLPSVLLVFAMFRPFAKHLRIRFTPNENVMAMTVAASMGGIPYTAGLCGVIPALEFLLPSRENGPVTFDLPRLMLWCLSVCLFGIVVAVPLRNYFVTKSGLKFPTGTASKSAPTRSCPSPLRSSIFQCFRLIFQVAAVIGVLHNRSSILENIRAEQDDDPSSVDFEDPGAQQSLEHNGDQVSDSPTVTTVQWDLGLVSLAISACWVSKIICIAHDTLTTSQALLAVNFPDLKALPIFGSIVANEWGWAIDMSPAYLGYGMIMRPSTTAHMLLGAFIGWAVLSPIAKMKGWAPGPTRDWETGSQGWTIWVSLGVILGDSLVGICWILISFVQKEFSWQHVHRRFLDLKTFSSPNRSELGEGAPLLPDDDTAELPTLTNSIDTLSGSITLLWFLGIITMCVVMNWYLFSHMLSVWHILLSVGFIFPLSMASIRSMGETDNALASSLGLCAFAPLRPHLLINTRQNSAISLRITRFTIKPKCYDHQPTRRWHRRRWYLSGQ